MRHRILRVYMRSSGGSRQRMHAMCSEVFHEYGYSLESEVCVKVYNGN